MIRFEHVSKQFPGGTEALKDITLTIPKDKLTVIIGPSGCGKTTLLRMINKLEEPTDGEVYIDEELISKRDEVELRRSIGYVIQRVGLIPHMTIEQNVSIVPEMLNWKQSEISDRVEELLHLVNLDPKTYKSRYPLELSGGQQQRVGVIRALAANPNILLMDEPFSALDPISREQLQFELKNLQEKINKTIVFVTHDMDEALKIADNLIIMRFGKIEQIGTPYEVIEQPVNEFVRDFIGVKRIEQSLGIGMKKLIDFEHLLERNGEGQEVSSNMTLQEAANILETPSVERLMVMKDGKNIGSVSQTSLLRAILQKEVGANPHE